MSGHQTLGYPNEPRNFNHAWDIRCRKAGVRKITVHDRRRTRATLLIDLDVHPREVMQQFLKGVKLTVKLLVDPATAENGLSKSRQIFLVLMPRVNGHGTGLLTGHDQSRPQYRGSLNGWSNSAGRTGKVRDG